MILDVSEIRSKFLLSEDAGRRINLFRSDRIAKIIDRDVPVRMLDNPALVLHSIPLSTNDPSINYNFKELARHPDRLQPMYSAGWNHRYNYDGFLTYAPTRDSDENHAYLQIFRNGTIETVNTLLLRRRDSGALSIPSQSFEEILVDSTGRILSQQQSIDIPVPIFIMISLLNVKGYTMGVSAGYDIDTIQSIDRDHLILPEIVVDDYGVDIPALLRPAFDSVWNASGFAGSIYYDADGNWTGRRGTS